MEVSQPKQKRKLKLLNWMILQVPSREGLPIPSKIGSWEDEFPTSHGIYDMLVPWRVLSE